MVRSCCGGLHQTVRGCRQQQQQHKRTTRLYDELWFRNHGAMAFDDFVILVYREILTQPGIPKTEMIRQMGAFAMICASRSREGYMYDLTKYDANSE